MARPLRIERARGRYHATARGNERRYIFRDETDCCHFLELLSEMPELFGTRLHAELKQTIKTITKDIVKCSDVTLRFWGENASYKAAFRICASSCEVSSMGLGFMLLAWRAFSTTSGTWAGVMP
jgi:hypothetical protein